MDPAHDLPPPPPPARRTSPWIYVLIGCGGCGVVLVLLAIVAIVLPAFLAGSRASNDRNASASLKTILTAQGDFRSNDRDMNGVNDFWTADVRGLYDLSPEGNPIRLIEPAIAMADADPVTPPSPLTVGRQTRSGFWFAAIREDEQGRPYSVKDGRNPARFAFCAWPSSPGAAGKYTYITDENATVWRKDNGGRRIERWPGDLSAEGWERFD